METTHFQPVPTGEIPMPVVEVGGAPDGQHLPRILLQAASEKAASRRVALLALGFLAIAGVEFALLLRIPAPEPLVVYHDVPRKMLMEPVR